MEQLVHDHCTYDQYGYTNCRECEDRGCNDEIVRAALRHDCDRAFHISGNTQCTCGEHNERDL